MLFLGLNAFGDVNSIKNYTPTHINDMNYIELSNAEIDDFYVSSDTTIDAIPSEWNSTTILHAEYNNNTIAGNINWYLDTISNVLLKRKTDDGRWITIHNQEIKTVDDFNFQYDDYLCDSNTNYKYALVPITNGNVEGAYIYALNKETNRNEITANFEGLTIVGKDYVYTTLFEIGDCDTSREHKVGIRELMNSKKPKVFINSQTNYDKGTASGFFVRVDDNCNIDYNLSYEYRKDILDKLTDGEPKFLKMNDSRSWIIAVTNSPTDTTKDDHDIRIIEFDWIQTGDSSSEKDLYQNGLINVTKEYWSNYYR